ncbi:MULTISPECIES: fumarylacetoacetate hydrolase family protein [Streptomyces]|uniref:Fumarylacetoacetate hydrolase family protein n=1 Tax=Streptomyces sp. NBC_00093 TaxID=2975649 RepID=A0AAU1ZVK0_9ACTN
MKLSTVRLGRDRTAAARLQKKHCVVLPYRDVGALIASGDGWRERAAAETGERHRLDEVSYAPLIVRPGKVVSVDPGYAARARETGRPLSAVPEFRVRDGRRVVGAHDDICLPSEEQDVDWGVALGLVIGRRARGVTAETALSHVAGYTVVNDVTVRSREGAVLDSGPSPAVATAVGPALVTIEDAPMGGRGLTMSGLVDGRVRQKANTSELIFDVATVIAHVSTVVALLPGDLITTGTPAASRTGREPGMCLRPGMKVVASIRGLGELRNAVMRSWSQ